MSLRPVLPTSQLYGDTTLPCPPDRIELWIRKGFEMIDAGMMRMAGSRVALASVPWLCQQEWAGAFPASFCLIVIFKDDGVKRAMVVRLVPRKKGHEPWR